MVYTILYYATEAITIAFIKFILTLREAFEKRRSIVEEKPRERRMPQWGLFETITPSGWREYVYVGRSTRILAFIPDPANTITIPAYKGEPPTRLYFTFAEAASKNWFRDIEFLASLAERKGRGVEGAT